MTVYEKMVSDARVLGFEVETRGRECWLKHKSEENATRGFANTYRLRVYLRQLSELRFLMNA